LTTKNVYNPFAVLKARVIFFMA